MSADKKVAPAKASRSWRSIFVVLAVLALSVILLVYKIGTLIPKNSFENPQALGILSGHNIADNILFAPHKTLQYILLKIHQDSLLNLRLVSAIFGLVSVLLLFLLLRRWYTRRISFASMLLFASSTLFLYTSRLAGPEVMYLLALQALLLAGTWLKKRKDVARLPLSTALALACLYVPGLWIFVLVGIIAIRKRINIAFKLSSVARKVTILLSLAGLLAPLITGFVLNPDRIITWLGLPQLSSINAKFLLDNFVGIFKELFVSGFPDHSIWLSGTPVLDAFLAAALILGIYSYAIGFHPLRFYVLIAFSLLSIILITLGVVSLVLLLPLIYIFAANGVAFLLQQWFTVFPRNPVARGVGLILIIAAIAGSGLYQAKRYFIAWPNDPQTKQSFQLQKQ